LPSLPKLYAILDTDTLTARGLDPRAVLDAWLDAGVRLVQLRAKSMPSGALLTLAQSLATTAHSAGATFIVNDRADLASLAGADGVHVGQGDLTPTEVRAVLQSGTVPWTVGLSTHTLDQLRAGLAEPADYLAIGPVFRTATKAHADPVVGLDMVRAAAAITGDRPLVAIGGITLDTAPAVVAAGASSVAVISGLLSGDLRARARDFMDAICH
jgi:thiamine-phosphate pyrophosphorylase